MPCLIIGLKIFSIHWPGRKASKTYDLTPGVHRHIFGSARQQYSNYFGHRTLKWDNMLREGTRYLEPELKKKLIDLSQYCPMIRMDKGNAHSRVYKGLDHVSNNTGIMYPCHWNVHDKYRMLPCIIGALKSTAHNTQAH